MSGDQGGQPDGSHWMGLLGELFKWDQCSSGRLQFSFLPGTWMG